jgi:DNA-binding response OmpR family regulator
MSQEMAERAPRLRALHDDVGADEYALEHDLYLIGRAPSCQIIVARTMVSRLHAKVERAGTRYMISDAGSANGTFVDGRRIDEPQLLQNGTTIGLGSPDAVLRFEDPEATDVPRHRLWFDERLQSFIYNGSPLPLSKNLRLLLLHLYKHAGSTCSRESCIQAVWGGASDEDYIVMLHREINDLRRAIEQIAPGAQLIKNVRGVGYRLEL